MDMVRDMDLATTTEEDVSSIVSVRRGGKGIVTVVTVTVTETVTAVDAIGRSPREKVEDTVRIGTAMTVDDIEIKTETVIDVIVVALRAVSQAVTAGTGTVTADDEKAVVRMMRERTRPGESSAEAWKEASPVRGDNNNELAMPLRLITKKLALESTLSRAPTRAQKSHRLRLFGTALTEP